MAELTEEQLLLLNNLMYYSGSAENKTIEEIANDILDGVDVSDLSGGFEKQPDEMLDIVNAILEDPELCSMKVVESIHDDGVHAACVVDSNGNATVSIRGTGGTYEAWSDNLEGAYGVGTEIQKHFVEDFMADVAKNYDNITITGHSKGGNLAQYATIMMGDEIDRCVSFDGQGFNEEFCSTYADEIAVARDKITSICGDKDYVNILLESVAGETVYLETAEGENYHSAHALWEANEGQLVDGKYCNTVDQNPWFTALDAVADVLVKEINDMPDSAEVPLVNLLGSIVGIAFDKSMSLENLENENWEHVVKNVLDVILKTLPQTNAESKFHDLLDLISGGIHSKLQMAELITKVIQQLYENKKNQNIRETNGRHGGGSRGGGGSHGGSGRRHGGSFRRISDSGGSFGNAAIVANPNRMENTADTLDDCAETLRQAAEAVGRIRLDGKNFVSINRSISKMELKLEKNVASMIALGTGLREIAERYDIAEGQIVGYFD